MARIYSTEMFEGKRENLMMGEIFMKAQRIMRKTIPYGSRAEPDWYHGKRTPLHNGKAHIGSLAVENSKCAPPGPLQLLLHRQAAWQIALRE